MILDQVLNLEDSAQVGISPYLSELSVRLGNHRENLSVEHMDVRQKDPLSQAVLCRKAFSNPRVVKGEVDL